MRGSWLHKVSPLVSVTAHHLNVCSAIFSPVWGRPSHTLASYSVFGPCQCEYQVTGAEHGQRSLNRGGPEVDLPH